MNALPRLLSRRNAVRWAGLLACGLALAACAAGAAFAVRLAFDGTPSAPAAGSLALALALCGALAAVVVVVERRLAESLAQDHVARVRRALVRALFDREVRSDAADGAQMLRFVGDLGALRDWIANGAAVVPVALGTIPAALCGLWLLAPVLAVAPAIAAALAIGTSLLQGRRLASLLDAARRDRSRLARAMATPLANPGAYLLADEERRLLRRLRVCSGRIAVSAVRRRGVAAAVAAVGDGAMALATGGVLWLGLQAIQAGTIANGTLAAAITLCGFLGASVRQLALAWERRQAMRVVRRRLQAHLARAARRAAPRTGAPLPEGPLSLALQGVRLRAGGPRIDLDIAAGEIVCVHCEPAADGEPLLRMLAALGDPHAGELRIGGVPATAAARGGLRRAIAVLGDLGGPTPGTLRGHLRRARAAREESTARARPARARDRANDRPAPRPARVGRDVARAAADRTAVQLKLARARGARVFLLQPPTALDDLALARLLRDARRDGSTVLAIGADPRLSRDVDRVLLLDERGVRPLLRAAHGAPAHPASDHP